MRSAFVRTVLLVIRGLLCHCAVHASRQLGTAYHSEWTLRSLATSVEAAPRALSDDGSAASSDVSECILLFGSFCNGNMGDVIQPIAMGHLLSSVAPKQCFWYAHPETETRNRKTHVGEFFGEDASRLMHLGPRHAREVNRFKAFLIGGGGAFTTELVPLYNSKFAGALTLPVVIMGIGANFAAYDCSVLIEKASFVSGRDVLSIESLSSVLSNRKDTTVQPKDVALVRDPVLSDKTLSDTEGKCWKQSKGRRKRQPLCFVLPGSNTEETVAMHKQLVERVVRPGDIFVNVFPKHQKEIEAHRYPGKVHAILDPSVFTEKLCACRAIVSSRLHGVIMGLHMGVPTFGAFYSKTNNEISELVLDTMQLPDQFFLVDQQLTRKVVDAKVEDVRRAYSLKNGALRTSIHARLSGFYDEFQVHANYVLVGVIEPALAKSKPKIATWTLGSISAAWVLNDYVAAALLLACIVGLALLPSARSARRRPSHHLSSENSPRGDVGGIQKEISAAASGSSDSEHGGSCYQSPERSPVLRVRTAPGAAAASSKMLFMLNFSVWVLLAMGFGGYGKYYMSDTGDPVGLLVLEGVTGTVVLSGLGWLDLSPTRGLRSAAARQAGLAAILHTGQALLTNFAMLLGGVAVTNALKATEPAAAAILSYIFLGKRCSSSQVCAIVAIVTGVAVLTSSGNGSGSSEDGNGGNPAVRVSATIALAAVCCNALRNVVIKTAAPVPPHQTLFACSVAATFIGFGLMFLRFLSGATLTLSTGGAADKTQVGDKARDMFQIRGINAALCFVGQNFASFNILASLNPVGHAVGNACRYMLVFASGLLLLGEVMSPGQLGGAAIALVGVLTYNVAGMRWS